MRTETNGLIGAWLNAEQQPLQPRPRVNENNTTNTNDTMKKKKTKPTPPNLNGLHLWEIQSNRSEDLLWITTAKIDPGNAVGKATQFVRKQVGRHATVYISSLKYRGTIDA